MKYAHGTELVTRQPWGVFVSGRALCSDGRVRALARIAATADTFFSVPAAVKVKGKTVAGYVTVETQDGWTTVTETDPAVVKFVAYQNAKNANLLPGSAFRGKPELRQPKTRRLFVVQGNYDMGWEDVTAEDTRSEALERLREYRQNETMYAHRLITRRVPR